MTVSICTYERNEKLCPTLTRQRFEKSTSAKYRHYSTEDILQQFYLRGFQLEGISANKTRKEEKRGYQKHVCVLSHPDFLLGEEQLQVLVTNSHDGSSSLKFNIGVFRFVCANGMVTGDNFFTHRITHKGVNFIEEVNKGISETIRVMPLVADLILKMKNTKTTSESRQALYELTGRIRLGDKIKFKTNTIGLVKRKEDLNENLWTVFNRCQESLIRGGIKYQKTQINEDGSRKIKHLRTRAVRSPSTSLELNKKLWDATTELFNVA